MPENVPNIGPDAELLALGRRFDVLNAEYLRLYEKQEATLPAFRKAEERARELYRVGRKEEAAELRDHAEIDTGMRAASHALGDFIDDEFAPVMDAIEAATATTLAGLIAKAKVATWACTWIEEDRHKLDYDKAMAAHLIQAVLALPETSLAADAALFQLCDEALDLWQQISKAIDQSDDDLEAETTDPWKPFEAKCVEVARTRAKTLYGMQGKAVVLSFRYLMEERQQGTDQDEAAREQNLAWSLATDVMRHPC
jgi:hypothetical protein